MDRPARTGNWLRSHKRQMLVHSLILGCFLLYCLFLTGPLFDRLEVIPDEAKLVRLRLPDETNNMHFGLDRLIVSKTALEIQGWAFIGGSSAKSAEDHQTFIVLKSDKATYVFGTSAVFDDPVTAEYGDSDLNLDWSGFTTTIPLRKVEKGRYTVGVYTVKDGIAALQYSSKVIVKSSDSVKLTELSSRILKTTFPKMNVLPFVNV